jgi:crotonobetainyl-CoA:carnitine CoA-transferase CaiB-like acyl-CoA transferase
MLDVQVSLLTIAAARLFARGEDPERTGTEHPGRVPSAAFQCRDGGWIHISGSDQHWRQLCNVLELEHLANDESLRSNAGRLAARTRVMAALTEAIAARERAPLVAQLIGADVPVGEVNTVREVLADPHVIARKLQTSFDHPREGIFPALRQPLRLNGSEPLPVGAPPELGADTRAVLRNQLGLSEQEIEELARAGVI